MSVIRALLLVGLLCFFVANLCRNVREDQRQLGFGPLPERDPGVRVLLLDRGTNNSLNDTCEQVELTVLQPSWVLTPDDPENPERMLSVHHGERLIIQPDAGDGLVLWTQTYDKLRWPVSRIRIQPQATKPEIEPGRVPAKTEASRFEAADGEAVFAMNDRRYRGSLEVVWHGAKSLMAINALPMEAYVEAVIAVEMKSSYPLEALKAQAIVSRSYAFATWLRDHGKNREYVVSDSNDDQEYKGTGFGNTLVTAAVNETRGIVMFANGAPFVPMFSASSGGYSECIDAITPGQRDIYGTSQLSLTMPAQPDPYCEKAADALGNRSSHWLSTCVIKRVDIMRNVEKWLRRRNDSRAFGRIVDLKVGRRDPVSNRVQSLLISHTANTKPLEISGHDFRMLMGPYLIHSTLWTEDSPKSVAGADPNRKDYQIQCYGYGHGVGMSQISAWWMAKELNYTSDQIIQFFYPGVQLRAWPR